MKQCIKYLMITLLGVLLYDSAVQAAGVPYAYTYPEEERCVLSQAPITHEQDIRNILYDHFSSLPLYIDHVDSTQVPGNKSSLLLLNAFQTYRPSGSPANSSSPRIAFCPVPDPLSYYVFGLRKIII